jgi:hypothetical protein
MLNKLVENTDKHLYLCGRGAQLKLYEVKPIKNSMHDLYPHFQLAHSCGSLNYAAL